MISGIIRPSIDASMLPKGVDVRISCGSHCDGFVEQIAQASLEHIPARTHSSKNDAIVIAQTPCGKATGSYNKTASTDL
jgi:hypothetical protein